MQSWTRSILITAGLVAAFFAGTAGAVTFTFSTEYSGSGYSCSNSSCATLEVTQNGTGVDFLLTANLTTGEKLTYLAGNRSPYAASTAVNFGGTYAGFHNLINDSNNIPADGSHYYDWAQDFSTNDGLTLTQTFSWTFSNTTLADIINATSSGAAGGQYNFAIHVQGLGAGNQGSGWFYPVRRPGDVPEPGTLVLLGLGLVGLGLTRRKA